MDYARETFICQTPGNTQDFRLPMFILFTPARENYSGSVDRPKSSYENISNFLSSSGPLYIPESSRSPAPLYIAPS